MDETTAKVTRRYGRRMMYLAWIAIFGLLYLFFDDKIAAIYNPNESPESLAAEDGLVHVTLLRNRYGHYVTNGRINSHTVQFLLDTGATDINIPETIALRLQLQRGQAFRAMTANGTVTNYKTRLDSVEVGDIRLEGVEASINPHMGGDGILLGMSFLRELDFRQDGKRLTLTGPTAR